MATTQASLEQYFGYALARVKPDSGGLEPTGLQSISRHSPYKAATFNSGTEVQDFQLTYEGCEQNIEFEITTHNGRTVLSSHSSLATQADSYPIQLRHLPSILTGLQNHEVLHGKNIAMLQFPIALSLTSIPCPFRLPIRQHFVQLALVKNGDRLDAFLVDSTGNPLGIGGHAAYIFSMLTSISCLDIQCNRILNSPEVKTSLSQIFNFASGFNDLQTKTINTGVQPIFRDKRCAVFSLAIRIKLMQLILSMPVDHDFSINDDGLREFCISTHKFLDDPIVNNQTIKEISIREQQESSEEDSLKAIFDKYGDELFGLDEDFTDLLAQAKRSGDGAASAAGEQTRNLAELVKFFENYEEFRKQSEQYQIQLRQQQRSPKKLAKTKSSFFESHDESALIPIIDEMTESGGYSVQSVKNYSAVMRCIMWDHFKIPERVSKDEGFVIINDEGHITGYARGR